MTVEDEIRAFMLDPERRPMLTVYGIQKACGIPEGNLDKFLKGTRPKLPANQLQKLVEKLKVIGFGLVEVTPKAPTGSNWGNTLPLFDDTKAQGTLKNLQAEIQETKSKVVELSPLARLYEDKDKMPITEFIQNRDAILEAERREEHWQWVQMPPEITYREIEGLKAKYKKRKMKTALFVQLRVKAPLIENRNTWTCYLELVTEKGKLYKEYKKKASPAFCESIFSNKEWEESNFGGVSFYRQPIGNPVIEPKEKVKKVKPVAAKTPKSGYLLDVLS